MTVRLVDEVYDDLRTSRDWNDKKRYGLGCEYAEVFFDDVNALPRSATHSAVDETGDRRKRMPRFTEFFSDLIDSENVIVGIL